MNKSWRNSIILYYIANWLYKHGIPFLPWLLEILLFFACNAAVPYQTQIGANCILGHGGGGVVIHKDSQIGNNVMICQQVTIGGTGIGTKLPVIGNDVYLGAGAKIIGPVTVGNNSVIGANAVVVRSVPSLCVVAGVPACVIRENIDAHCVEKW